MASLDEEREEFLSSAKVKNLSLFDFRLLNLGLTVFRQGRTLLDQGCPNFDKTNFGASVHEKIEI